MDSVHCRIRCDHLSFSLTVPVSRGLVARTGGGGEERKAIRAITRIQIAARDAIKCTNDSVLKLHRLPNAASVHRVLLEPLYF